VRASYLRFLQRLCQLLFWLFKVLSQIFGGLAAPGSWAAIRSFQIRKAAKSGVSERGCDRRRRKEGALLQLRGLWLQTPKDLDETSDIRFAGRASESHHRT
jgi:hypothetical protein